MRRAGLSLVAASAGLLLLGACGGNDQSPKPAAGAKQSFVVAAPRPNIGHDASRTPLAAATVDQGTILVNRGAGGIELGMTRAQVVARLGKPLYQNANGYMQYSRKQMFDIYLDVRTRRVHTLGIAGPRFCTPEGACLQTPGALRKLRTRYGALQGVQLQDGPKYIVYGTFHGRGVFTSFEVSRLSLSEPVADVFIGYCDGSC